MNPFATAGRGRRALHSVSFGVVMVLLAAAAVPAAADQLAISPLPDVCQADTTTDETLPPVDGAEGAERLHSFVHVAKADGAGAPTATRAASVSADGRYVGFEGGWTRFGSSSNSSTDVLVADLQSGSVANEHRNSKGEPGASGSGSPAIAADGSVVAFMSASGNLIPGTPSGALYDIYVANLTGSMIERVSTGAGDAKARGGRSQNPDISGDGRYVVFESTVTEWAGGSAQTVDIFIKDRASRSITRLSTGVDGDDGNADSTNPRISRDGRYVVFQSEASNLSANDTNGYADVFVWDRANGSLTNVTQPATSRNSNNRSARPDIATGDGSGAIVVFESARAFVAADTNNAVDIYAYNLTSRTFRLVSSKANGSGVAIGSEEASISDDGRFVAFTSYADDLVPGDGNGTRDIFVKNLANGAIARVSQNGAIVNNQASLGPEISSSGQWIVFESGASNLVATDVNGTQPDVFRAANPLLGDPAATARDNQVHVADGVETLRTGSTQTLPDHVENLRLTGAAAIDGTGNALDNQLVGNESANKLMGLAGDDSIHGCGGNDLLEGGDGNDLLDGGAGSDNLKGGPGDDIYVANANTDIVSETVNAGTDTVRSAVTWTLAGTLENLELTGDAPISGTGNATTNRVFGNNTANTLRGGGGDDVLAGRGGNDVLLGEAGNDWLDGGAGSDNMTGGPGDDTYVCDAATDIISETVNAGTDSVQTAVTWTLQPTLENLELTGEATINGTGNNQANDVLGNSTANKLSGAGGDDRVEGRGGDDELIGGFGNDQLTGGDGADVFTLETDQGTDTIADFATGTDRLRFRMQWLRIGNGNTTIDAAVEIAGPGGFAPAAEIVIVTGRADPATAPAAAIGSATSSYAVGDRRLFIVAGAGGSEVYLFTASEATANVLDGDLKKLATLTDAPALRLTDLTFAN